MAPRPTNPRPQDQHQKVSPALAPAGTPSAQGFTGPAGGLTQSRFWWGMGGKGFGRGSGLEVWEIVWVSPFYLPPFLPRLSLLGSCNHMSPGSRSVQLHGNRNEVVPSQQSTPSDRPRPPGCFACGRSSRPSPRHPLPDDPPRDRPLGGGASPRHPLPDDPPRGRRIEPAASLGAGDVCGKAIIVCVERVGRPVGTAEVGEGKTLRQIPVPQGNEGGDQHGLGLGHSPATETDPHAAAPDSAEGVLGWEVVGSRLGEEPRG
ncbi:hypothetical protein B0T16DRAFT_8158 [Cercophora newfieldiana]|uniref:Uncharacterized protein n=1 Tax=Cercophora newfieldiana TaxID=92897 RepID=A0AA39YMG5_9PEZI|nr:hypothetical protein B0T16DRAFT_8158 [Cercophora newfieldiana]